MINGFNGGGCRALSWQFQPASMLFVAKKGGCVWLNGVHGNRGPGYRPMCKGDLWPLEARQSCMCKAELYVYAVRRYDN